MCDLPHTTSCKKPRVSGKPNARKWPLTDTMYLANAIANIATGSTRVGESKIATANEIWAAMVDANKGTTKSNNDVML